MILEVTDIVQTSSIDTSCRRGQDAVSARKMSSFIFGFIADLLEMEQQIRKYLNPRSDSPDCTISPLPLLPRASRVLGVSVLQQKLFGAAQFRRVSLLSSQGQETLVLPE